MKRFYKMTALVLACALVLGAGAGLFAPKAAADEGKWVSCWGSSLVNGSISLAGANFQDVIPSGSTLRTVLTVTTGGSELSFTFSNQYGAAAITISAAGVARSDTENRNATAIIDGSQTPITFNNGEASVTIPAGTSVESDPVKFKTKALETIAISLYFENFTYMTSVGLSNGRTFLRKIPLSNTPQINSKTLTNSSEVDIGSGAITYHTIPFLERIDTLSREPNACTAVFIGDSTLVNDTYLYYARRIVSAGVKNVGVINEAIIGNKLLSNGSGVIGNLYGPAMKDRFQRDVLDIDGVKYCFVKIGLNDVLHQFSKTLAAATPQHSPEDIIAGYRALIRRCHEKGIKIYFFTKSAWKGYERNFLGSGVDITWTQEEQDMCDKLTKWVLTNKEADGFIDCAPLADPSDPTRLCPSFTPDGAHLTALGSIALADLIPLEYVGVPKGAGKTAAQLTKTDPYAEKRQIILAMEEARYTTTTQAPATQEPTAGPSESAAPTNAYPVESTASPYESTAYPTEPTTFPVESTTSPYETTTLPPVPSTTAPAAPGVDSYTVFNVDPNAQMQVTDPYTVPSESYTYVNEATGAQQNVTYNVSNDADAVKGSVGEGASVGFLLIFVLAVSIAAAVTILTMMKKKENI